MSAEWSMCAVMNEEQFKNAKAKAGRCDLRRDEWKDFLYQRLKCVFPLIHRHNHRDLVQALLLVILVVVHIRADSSIGETWG